MTVNGSDAMSSTSRLSGMSSRLSTMSGSSNELKNTEEEKEWVYDYIDGGHFCWSELGDKGAKMGQNYRYDVR